MDRVHQQDPIVVRTRLAPQYYDHFQCLAGACRDTCCAGWGITFSKKDYLKIKRASKPLELEKLTKQAMHRLPRGQTAYAEFASKEGPCPFQSEEGLCRLQMLCGEETLPEVCQQFPRRYAYTPMGWEEVMSTACEAVVLQLWNLSEGITFVEDTLPRSKWSAYPVVPETLRFPIMREVVIDTLQDRKLSLTQRLLVIGLLMDYARRNWDDFSLSSWRSRAELLRKDSSLSQKLVESKRDSAKFLAENTRVAVTLLRNKIPIYLELEEMGVHYHKDNEGEEIKGNISYTRYEKARKAFEDYFGDISYFFENILVNQAFWIKIPDLRSPEDLWKSYVSLCSTYSFIRFMAVISCGISPSREKLFHGIVMASRGLMHNKVLHTSLRDQFFENQNESLAHMAMLVQA